MNYTLKDLLNVSRLHELLDVLDEISSMPSAITDTDGTVLIATAWQDICTRFHRQDPEIERTCIESNTHIEAQLDKKIPDIIYRCPMGLVDAATPIIIDGQHLGNVFSGQLFLEPPDETYFIEQARRYGFDENEYLAAVRKVPVFPEEKIHKNLKFIHNLTVMLAEQGLQYARQFEVEEKLRESETVFRCLFEDINDPISLLKKGRFIDCNDSLLRLLGYTCKSDFLNCCPSEISPLRQPDGRLSEEKAGEMIALALQTGYHRFEWVHTRADGSPVPVEVTLTPMTVGGEKLLHTLWRDITGQKRAEEELMAYRNMLQEQNEELQMNEESLREQNDELLAKEDLLREQILEYETSQQLLKKSEARQQAMIANIVDVIAIIDRQGINRYKSPNIEKWFGWRPEEVVGQLTWNNIHPDDLQRTQSLFASFASDPPGTQKASECRYRCKDGSYKWINFTAVSLLENQDIKGILVCYHDITAQKKANDLLLSSQQQLSTLIETLPDAVFLKDGESRWLVANQVGVSLFGLAGQPWHGKTEQELMLLNPAAEAALHCCVKSDEQAWQSGGQLVTEERVQRKDGSWRDFEVIKVPLLEADGRRKCLVVVGRDVTERKEHEKEQLKIEKLESLGVLAGGIAHDFNNIMSGVVGNISFAQMFLDAGHKSFKPLVEAEKAALRATDLARQLLTFARGGEPVKKIVSLQECVKESISLALHGSNVKAAVDIPDTTHAIDADEGQLSQVFHNIIINASQAMAAGGELTVTGRNEKLADSNPMSLPAGDYVRLEFADQGFGIAADDLPRIFDPYFTTKSSGNGLGLASVHSIVNRHGGHIGASSVQGQGTTFTIYLPSIGETYSQFQSDVVTQTAGNHSGGTVLVMDDEEMIRDMTSEMLEYLGYQVTTAVNGAETIMQYKAGLEAGSPYAAVIMDLTIPGGMGGKEAAQLILAIDPQACLIVSSGYSNDPIMADFSAFGFSGAVAKPYKIKALGLLLSDLLGGRT